MATAKHLYLYGVSAASLVIGLLGATILFQVLVNNLHVGNQFPTAAQSTDIDRLFFSIGFGLLVAGLIVWVFHWAIVERMVRGSSDEAAGERRSIVRSLYFVWALGASLPIALWAWTTLIAKIVADRAQAPAVPGEGAGDQAAMVAALLAQVNPFAGDSGTLAIGVAATAMFVYHVWIRDRDLRETDLISGAAAWLSRFYLYGAALVGLVVALMAVSSIVEIFAVQWAAVQSVAGMDATDFSRHAPLAAAKVPTGADWVRPFTEAAVTALAFGAAWYGHWLYSLRLRDAKTPQGEAERISKVRLAFLAVVVLWGVRVVIENVGFGAGQVVASFTDVKNTEPTWYLVLVLPIMAIPAGAAWWWHRKVAMDEEPTGPVGLSATRIVLYVTALAGLAAASQGAFKVIDSAIVQIFSKVPADLWKLPVAFGIGAIVVGGAVWYYMWRQAEVRMAANRATDVTAWSRMYYLYAILGASAVAFTAGLAVFVWQYTEAITGPKPAPVASIAGIAIGLLVVAGALLLYHSWIYRRDAATPEGQALVLPMRNPAAPVATSAAGGRGRTSAKPDAAKPAAEKPAAEEPAAEKPATAKAATAKAATAKPARKRTPRAKP